MSYIHRHVDRFARCAVKLVGETLTFQRGPHEQRAVALEVPGLYARVDVDEQGVAWAVVMDAYGRAVLVREDGLQRVLATSGIGAGFAHLRGSRPYLWLGAWIHVLNPDGTSAHVPTDTDGVAVPLVYHVPYASEGIHHIDPDGTPVTEDATRYPTPAQRLQLLGAWPFADDDAGLMRVDAHHGMLFGQFANYPGVGLCRGDRLYTVTPTVPGWNLDSQQSSAFGVRADGELWFAVPGHDTPEPWEFTLVPHTRASAPPVTPPPAIDPAPPVVEPPAPPVPADPPPATPEPETTPKPAEPTVRERWDAYWNTFGRLKPPAWLRRAYERVTAAPPISQEGKD